MDTDRHDHRPYGEKAGAGDGEAGERGTKVIADPESESDARQDEAQADQGPAAHDHRDVAHKEAEALLDFQAQERDLLVEEPHRVAEKVLDESEDAPPLRRIRSPCFTQHHWPLSFSRLEHYSR